LDVVPEDELVLLRRLASARERLVLALEQLGA
jgi:hypothetical protein